MRFTPCKSVPESCLFGLVETSFQRAVKMYQLECKRLEKRDMKVSQYHSSLSSDGFTWILTDEDDNLLACADPLHGHVSLKQFPVAGYELPEGLKEFCKKSDKDAFAEGDPDFD